MNYPDGIERWARTPEPGAGYVGPSSGSYGFRVSVDGSAIARAAALLAGVEGGAEKAMKGAVKKAAAYLRSSSTKAIREQYDISAANIRANENITIRYEQRNGPVAYIHFAGSLIPLIRFGGASPSVPTKDTSGRSPVMIGNNQWRRFFPSVPAHGHALKSTSPALFTHAFTARMKTGHIGIYERTGGMTAFDKDEIEELFGPSIPEMLGKEEVAEKLSKETMGRFEDELNHQINAILYGG